MEEILSTLPRPKSLGSYEYIGSFRLYNQFVRVYYLRRGAWIACETIDFKIKFNDGSPARYVEMRVRPTLGKEPADIIKQVKMYYGIFE